MTTNVLIGVGGTGAKIVESALYLFLAGLGPSKVIVGLVDQDSANGNVARTKTLINDMVQFREDWNSGNNRLDWSVGEDKGGAVLGRVEIERFFGTECHWRPEQDGQATLAVVLQRQNMPEEQRVLFDMLFAPGETEQDMPLTQGYQGRAHIGSAAMLASLERDIGGFDRRTTELVQMAKQDQDVRIFLAGSVFGGTGAAGFPTLARAINRIRSGGNQAPNRDHVRVAGALMLPYFGFQDAADPQANVVKAAELLPQARSALEYYDHLLANEPVFEQLYMIGWDQFFQLKYHEPGKDEQKNPPFAPELIAAVAALDFFDAKASPGPAGAPIMVSSRADARTFGWRDLPFTTPSHRDYAKKLVGQLLRFALYWCHRVEPALDQRSMLGGLKAPWLKDLAAGTDFKVETPEDRVRLNDLMQGVLNWAAAMHFFSTRSTGEALSFDLWDTAGLEDSGDVNKPAVGVGLRKSMSSEQVSSTFDALIKVDGGNSERDWRGAGTLFDEINRSKGKTEAKNLGLGRLVAAIHNAARPTEVAPPT